MALDDAAKAVKTVIVKGLGKIKFPASMADDEIAGIIQRHAQLDMSDAARMARAKGMGFGDEPMYHASSKVFAGGRNAAEAEKYGIDVADEFLPQKAGTYFTPDSEQVRPIFAKEPFSGNVDEFRVKKGNAFDARWRSMSDNDKKKLKEIINGEVDDGDIADAAERLGVSVENADPFEVFTDGEFYHAYGRDKQDKIIKRLLDEGYDSVVFPDSLSLGTEHVSTVIKSPNQIRSVNAAFNPELSFSGNILASAAPAAVGLGLLSSLVSPESQASEQRAINRLTEMGQSRPTGTIQAAQHPLLGRAANALLSFQTPLDPLTGPQFQNTANLLQKFNYGDKRSYWDYFNANLDWM